jgi:hypothetical protein
MTNQRRNRIPCLLYIKHDTHIFPTIFNVLPYLISLTLATCDGTTVLYRTEDNIRLLLYINVLSVGARSLLVFSFTLRSLYLRCPVNSTKAIAQSEQQLATGWKVLGSNPGVCKISRTNGEGP